MLLLLRVFLGILLCTTFDVFAQSPITGSQDFGLGGSSVMWLPRPSSLFLNPAEISHIHQGDMLVSTHRFSSLPSLSAAYFVPFVGTFAGGVANLEEFPWYSIAYGRVLSDNLSMGIALNVLRAEVNQLSGSAGASLHFPVSISPNSGFHVGASATNFSSKISPSPLSVDVGAAYWIVPNALRLQTAWQLRQEKGEFLGGIFYRFNSLFSAFAGTISFKEMSGGIGLRLHYLYADLAFGKAGLFFSLSFRFTDDARDVRDRHFGLGKKAYDEERYSEANGNFLTALEYDEYYSPAREFAKLSHAAKETALVVFFREGKTDEERGNYVQAMKMYWQVLKTDPDHQEAQTRYRKLKLQFHNRVVQLITTGDSLRNLKKYDVARDSYRAALDMDPDNPDVPPRLDRIDSVIQREIQLHFTRARAFVAKNQMDDALKEYEQILQLDPQNTVAQSRFESLKARRTLSDLVNRGKTTFERRDYFEALTIFLEVLQRDPNNRDAKSYLDRCREFLQRDVEEQFKTGLQHYVKEDYQSALEVWNRVVVIQPNHQATLEYSKRAKDKLEALEKLK